MRRMSRSRGKDEGKEIIKRKYKEVNRMRMWRRERRL